MNYLNQCWLIISASTNVDLSSVKSCDNHLRVISQEIPQPSVTEINFENYLSKISSKSLQWVKMMWHPVCKPSVLIMLKNWENNGTGEIVLVPPSPELWSICMFMKQWGKRPKKYHLSEQINSALRQYIHYFISYICRVLYKKHASLDKVR